MSSARRRTAPTSRSQILAQARQAAILYRAGDCFLQNSDQGFGAADATSGAVSCVAGVDNGGGTVPGTRIEQWYPLSGGSSYFEYGFNYGLGEDRDRRPPSPTAATSAPDYIDNGAGLSWNVTHPGWWFGHTIAPHASSRRSGSCP